MSAFAILEPSNLEAKLDFDYVARRLNEQAQGTISNHQRHICTGSQQQYDSEVYRFRRRQEDDVDDLNVVSATSTEIDTDVDDDDRSSGMVWTGHYSLSFSNPPTDARRGWVAGKCTTGDDKADLLLGLMDKRNNVRGRHIIFNFHHTTTGFLSILSRASKAGHYRVVVNAQPVPSGQTYSLNQNPMTICLGTLEYIFRYTDFAETASYREDRDDYLNNTLGVSAPVHDLAPTKAIQLRTFGSWTMNSSVGKGTFGRVHSATNCKGRLVAIKIVDRAMNSAELENEITVLKELTKLADTTEDYEDSRAQPLRLVEVIDGERDRNRPTLEVALVLEPCVERTFQELRVHLPESRIMELFVGAMQGVHFLHSNDWLHGDLKPGNIGCVGSKAVLLDMGGATKLCMGDSTSTRPGTKGTVNYLAPEQEMGPYDHRVDVWSLGVILFELVYGYHPWLFQRNPWRPENVSLRNGFHDQYEKSLTVVRENVSQRKGGIDVASCILQMTRHSWAKGNHGERISVAEALGHPCWRQAAPNKRLRIEEDGEASFERRLREALSRCKDP